MIKNAIHSILISIISMNLAYAQIYFFENEKGDTIYSNIKPTNHENIKSIELLNEKSIAPKTKIKHADKTTQKKEIEEPSNNSISIITPEQNESFHNQPIILVKLKTENKLRNDDKIQIYLDDKPYGEAIQTLTTELTLIDRGTHTLYALILDSNGKIISRSQSITIYIHKTSINTKVRK